MKSVVGLSSWSMPEYGPVGADEQDLSACVLCVLHCSMYRGLDQPS